MCSEEKKATLWSSYLNAQYSILWENATKCGNDETRKCIFYRALATCRYSAETGEVVTESEGGDRITFTKPELLFLCNHAVALYLTVEEGVLTGIKDAEGQPLENIDLKGRRMSFRMTFTRTHVMGRDSKIDDQAADHEVRMVIFDFDAATVVPDIEEAPVKQFFTAYLKFLRAAGHHVLFGLPDFTDQMVLETLPVDYARLPKVNVADPSTTLTLDEFSLFSVGITYFNITVEQINTFLKVSQHQRADVRAQEKHDILAASISSVRWSHASTAYNVTFDAPSIIALCAHELLFVFKLRDIKVENQTETVLNERTIVFVVNLSEYDGKTLKVDFRTARFMSFFSSIETTDSTSLEASFLEWMRVTYFETLTKYEYNVIYSPEVEKPRALIRDGGFWRRVHNVTDFLAIRRYSESAIWLDRSQHMYFSGVDQAFALSERSIEHFLRTKWEEKEEHRYWEQDTVGLKARIGPLRIHLLSNNKVVVLVDIEEVELAPRAQAQSKLRSAQMPPRAIFAARRGKTEVEIEAQAPVAPPRKYKGLLAFEVVLLVSLDEATQVHQFFLDIPSARPIESLTDVWNVSTREKTDEATTTIIRGHIFKHLTDMRELITIGSIAGRETSTFSMSILSEKDITIENFLTNRLDVSDSSLIVLYSSTEGTTDNVHFKWSPGWLPTAESNGIGTVWISSKIFIQKILAILEEFNAETTIVRDTDDSFVTLKKRGVREERKQWQQDTKLSDGDCLAFSWYYNYDATRREIGTYVKHNWDSIILRTENYVWIPTEVSPSNDDKIVLALTGEHEIRASRKGLPDETATVRWQLTITISTTSTGFAVEIKSDSAMDPPEGPGPTSPYNPKERIMDRLDELVDSAQTQMNDLFKAPPLHNWFGLDEEQYQFSNPIFTRSNDLVYEVYKRSSAAEQTAGQPSSTPSQQPTQEQAAPQGPGGPGGAAAPVQQRQPQVPPQQPATPAPGSRAGTPRPRANR